MARTGVLMRLSQKLGKDISEIKSAIMKAATGAYRLVLKELGLSKGNATIYRAVLRHTLPIAWRIVREEEKIPTPEEVFTAMTREWPTWKEELQGLLAKAKAGM